ncbi:zinc finger protein 800-like [Lytechinus variegatus]|uniref:zinc finger protein 800-like n=1 Tax=Lytechinus variegatus TaxID=7654 RepID=UPI001BB1C0FF|nr:zinc finger protein 800-like [Lytechinus variegatus]XP_041478986.1 zinc finger protein 800-like [Lytechinus variegatus]
MATKMAEPPRSKGNGLDSSQLLPPMHTSRRGLQQVLDLFRNATPNLKELLLQEADIIYECRVCKGLFRGLVNFIEHKRSYCKLLSGIDQHCATKTLGLNMRDLFPNEDAAAPQVEPQPPTCSPVNERGVAKRNVVAPIINDQSSEVGNTNAYLVLRPIPNTTEAIEQQVVRSDHIIHHDELDKMSVFAPKPEGGDTSKIVGEIAIRQATKNAKTTIEKRETLHSIVKGFRGKNSARRELFEGVESSQEAQAHVEKVIDEGRKSGAPKKVISLPVKQSNPLQEPKEKNLPGTVACQPTECTICKKKCKNWTALAWHMRIHKRPIFKCSLCRYSSVSVYNLRRHMQTMHHLPTARVDELLSLNVGQQKIAHEGREKEAMKPGEGSSLPTCDICFKTFANRRNVLRHKEIHRREQLSSDLNRGSVPQTHSREEIARNKVLQIMDEKKLKCRRCHKQLSTMRRLQQHCCNHFGFNRYRCMLCPYENNDYTQMRRHMMGKHGRQFRTIHQISEAIRNMKVGIWVNLVQNGNGSSNDEVVSPNPRKSKDLIDSKMTAVKLKGKCANVITPKKLEIDDTSDLNGNDVEMEDNTLEIKGQQEPGADKDDEENEEDEADEDEEEDDEEEDEDEDEEEEEVEEDEEEEEEEKEVDTEKRKAASNKESAKNEGRSGKSQSNKENKVVPKTPSKQSAVNSTTAKDILWTPPSSNGARKSPEPTPSRDMPIRQARLNHQSVSPRNQAEKTQGEKPIAEKTQQVKRDLTKTSGEKTKGSKSEMDEEDKNALELLMDKRLVRCLNCNKRYQYLSSLQRHVRIHLLRNETGIPQSTATKNPADTSKKHNAIESLINTNLLKCLKCRKRFESMSSLKRHVARHLGYSSFKCKFCGYLSRNYTWFKQHLKMKHADRITDMTQMGSLIGSMKTKK